MNYTLQSLMQAAGCAKWPERWQEIFDTAMARYDQAGCSAARPELYLELQEKYGCFPEYLDVYTKVAAQVATKEPLARLLVLLDEAMRDRAHIRKDLTQFAYPTPPAGEDPLPYTMLPGLALGNVLEPTAQKLAARGIPRTQIVDCLTRITQGVNSYKWHHNNQLGYDLFGWAQRYLDAELFYFNGIGVELNCRGCGLGRVFCNAEDKQVILADNVTVHKSGYALGSACCTDPEGAFLAEVTQTDTHWEGHPVLPDGRVDTATVRLPKGEWQQLLDAQTPVLGLHIDRGTSLAPAVIEGRLEEICRFLDTHFPEVTTRIFTCVSWLMDPQLQQFLSEDSNIVQFQKRFRVAPRICKGRGVFFFIFDLPDEVQPDLESLPTTSSLQAGVVAQYKAGKAIYELPGYYLHRPLAKADTQ